MNLIPLPAFTDNYIWLLHDGDSALAVDPGDAQPVIDALQREGLRLEAILVTHHHPDHTAGVDALRQATGAAVWGPARERMPEPVTRVHGSESIRTLGLDFAIIDVPGHTAGHIAYFVDDVDGAPVLFCGDTLFSGGCGRLFEGTPAQMLASLDSLAALPGATRVCCTHEYTLANLRFAMAAEPDNAVLADYFQTCLARRQQQQPTLPSTLSLELKINPFLRTRLPALTMAARAFDPQASDEVSVFGALRQWKNQF
jgi:hydroxyacylglutathione hydrolase